MAHESKLEVYKIYLKTTAQGSPNTFKDFYQAKFKLKEEEFVFQEAHKEFLKSIVKSLDNDFFKSERQKKAFGLEKNAISGTVNENLKRNSAKSIIYGTIQGGRYGQNRSIGNIDKPSRRTKISDKNIVLDKFYMLLYTPVGSSKGLLFLQSYTDDSINEIVKNWLKKAFKTDGFYLPTIETYSPLKIQKEFKKYSIVKELKYSKDIVINDITVKDSIATNDFTVEIIIRAKEGVPLSKLNWFEKTFSKSSFKAKDKTINLEDFNKKVGQLNNGDHQSSFVLNDKVDITPTIFLKEKITLQEDGSPDWTDLNRFSQELLLEVIEEVYPEKNEIS